MIFAGVPVSILALIVLIDSSEHFINDRFWPYVVFGIAMTVAVLGMVAYNITPKRLVLPIGIVGWVVVSSILIWVGWFGPHGAFGHH